MRCAPQTPSPPDILRMEGDHHPRTKFQINDPTHPKQALQTDMRKGPTPPLPGQCLLKPYHPLRRNFSCSPHHLRSRTPSDAIHSLRFFWNSPDSHVHVYVVDSRSMLGLREHSQTLTRTICEPSFRLLQTCQLSRMMTSGSLRRKF